LALNRRTLLAATGAAAFAGSAQAQAPNFPRKAIQMIVAYPAGGNTDIGARILAAIAEKEFGQPVVVVNKGGAGGQLGFTEGARAKPDGYTVTFINLPAVSTIVLDPERKAAFGMDSFIPVINQVLDPGVVWVKADSPFKTFADLLDGARKAPGKLSACTTGILSDDHLAILMTQEAAKVEFRMVHFEGSAQQLTGVLGGHVDSAFDNVGGVFKRVKSGELRALVVTDDERSKFLPDVPCTKELGFPSVISSSTRGIAVPKGTPKDIVKIIEAGFAKAINNPEHIRKMEEQGLALKPLIGADYAKYYAESHKQATKYMEWALKTR
jgi:tripartite-type tricarboxylate transporter receptor subunit TctC